MGDYYIGEAPLPREEVRGNTVWKNRVHWVTGALSPNMDFLGRVRRTVRYENKNVRDSVVEAWMKADDVRFEESYVMCTPNAPAMTKSIAKYNRVQPLLNKEAWKLAGQWTEKHFVRMNGSMILPLARVMKEADRQTSAGYPWNLKYVNKGAFMDSPEFVGVMDRYWEALGTEEEMVPIWTASLKHEMRPIAKIESNSIRTFTASPTEHSLACNRLFLDQNELFYKAHTTTWSFVGCSKYYLGFDRLYKRLSKHPNAFELDESAFDASLFREALEGQREIRWGMLRPFDRTPENRKRVENVYKSIIDSIIVLDNGEVVQKHTGNPSGSANTIVDNTMILYRLFAYAWLCLVAERMEEGRDFLNQGQFESHVEAALNGDDNTFTCSDAVVSWFNPRSISKVWTGIGVVTTMPHMKNCPFEEKGDALTCKNPECEKPRRLEQVAFLSQEFVKIDDIWLPKPERNKILCSLLNASELDDPRWTLLRVSALRMESWPDVQLRKELVRLQQYIWKHYAFSMKGSVKDISMKDIAALWKTDEEIRRLYMCPKLEAGYEDMQKMESIMAIGGSEVPRFLSESKELRAGASLRLRKCAVCTCEVVTYCVEEHYSCVDCRLKIDEVQESVKPVPQDYKSPPPNKWRGKGKGSKGFNSLSQSLNLYGDTEMRIPYMTKSGKAKGKGAAQKKKGAQPKKGKAKKKAKSSVGGMGPQAKRYAAPVQMGSVRTTQGAKSRPFTVTHRESLGTITSPGTGFTVSKQIAVNPGLPASFPWLSNIAQQYETYKFKKIRYCYETRSSTANAGVVIMVTNYDASESAFTSTQQAENYRGATVGQPWISFSHELTKASMNDYNRHYVRAGAPVSGTDIKTYDVGNFSLILSGISVAAGQLLGELYVEYVVDVFDPRVQVPLGQYLPSWHAVSGVGAATTAAPLTGGTIRAGSTLGITIASTSTVVVPDVGRYQCQLAVWDAAISAVPTITTAAGSTVVNLMNNNTIGFASGLAAGVRGVFQAIIDVTAPNAVLTINGGTGTAAGNLDLFISQISSGLTLKEQKEDEKQLEVKQDLQAIWALLKKAGLASTPMDVAGAAKASADGQPRRPYRAVEIDSDGESVLVNTAAAAGAGADRKDPPNGTPSQRRK